MKTKKVINKEPKKEIKLTRKQKAFCDKYIETGNATESAMQTYNCKNRNVARNVWPDNLAKPSIKHYLQDKWDLAWEIIEKLMTKSKKEDIKLNSAKFIYEQAYWKAIQKNINEVENKIIISDQDRELVESLLDSNLE